MLFAVLGTSCGGSKAIRQTEIPPNFYLKLERDICYGRCPAYVLEVDAEGSVAYTPQRFAPSQDQVPEILKTRQLQKLIHAIKEVNIIHFDEKYDNINISDLPSKTLTCTMDDIEKSIIMRVGAPKKLDSLFQELELIIFKKGNIPGF